MRNNDEDQDQVKDAMHNKGVDRDEGGDDVHICNNDENQY